MKQAIDLAEKLTRFSECRSPRVIAEMNDYRFKIVKLQGEFVWRDHSGAEEVFLVVKREMQIGFRNGDSEHP
jgi:hypothetical protein